MWFMISSWNIKKHVRIVGDHRSSRLISFGKHILVGLLYIIDVWFYTVYRVNEHSDKHFKLAREIPWILYGFPWWMSHSSLVLELASNPNTTLFLLNVGFNSIKDASPLPTWQLWTWVTWIFLVFLPLLRFFTIPILNRCLFLLCYFGGVSWWTRFVILQTIPARVYKMGKDWDEKASFFLNWKMLGLFDRPKIS